VLTLLKEVGTIPELLACRARSRDGVPPLDVYPRNAGMGKVSQGAPDEEVVLGTIKIAPVIAIDPNAIFGTGALPRDNEYSVPDK
jgi:hypothetical protein